MEGYGEFHDFKSDMLYIGFFEDNLYNGFGVLRNFKDNYIYIGEWKNNQREGVARFFKNKKEGFGKYKNNAKLMKYENFEEIIRSIDDSNTYLLPFFTTKKLEEILKFTSKKRIMGDN